MDGISNKLLGGGGGQDILVQKPEGRDHLRDLSRDGRIILQWLLKKCEGIDLIQLTHGRIQWQAL
jgi:hypothetical protein